MEMNSEQNYGGPVEQGTHDCIDLTSEQIQAAYMAWSDWASINPCKWSLRDGL